MVESRFVDVAGLRMHYLEWANPGRPLLLLLHGFRSHAHAWITVGDALADRYHIVALDQRGRGETAWASDYTFDGMVEDVAAFLAPYGSAIVMGHSLGGAVGYGLAARHPDRVARLIVVEMAPDLEPPGVIRIAQSTANQPDSYANPDAAGRAALGIRDSAPDSEVRLVLDHAMRQRDDGRWVWRYDPVLNPFRPPAADVQWALIGQVRCPVDVIHAAESDLVSAKGAGALAAAFPGSRLLAVPAAGHMIYTDNPAGFIAAARQLLA